MGVAIRFDGPAGQQQSQDNTENQLFLFRQAVHGSNLTKYGSFGKGCINPMAEIGDPKEARNPKSEGQSNSPAILQFGHQISFGFRPSNFGL